MSERLVLCRRLTKTLSFQVGVIPRITDLRQWLDGATLILVDIPIGLLTTGTTERLCDLAARQMIKPRGSTVFPAPARSAIYKDTFDEASAENHRCLGRKLSKQSFEICKKIREVDEFMRTVRPGPKVREMHPEVAFCGLNSMSPILTKKKRPDGFSGKNRFAPQLVPEYGRGCCSGAESGALQEETWPTTTFLTPWSVR